MFFISKIESGPLKISSVSEVMKESKLPASQLQKQKGDTPASIGTYIYNHSFKIVGKWIVLMYLYLWLRGWPFCMKDSHFRGWEVGRDMELGFIMNSCSGRVMARIVLSATDFIYFFFYLFSFWLLAFPLRFTYSLFAPIFFLFSSFFFLSILSN